MCIYNALILNIICRIDKRRAWPYETVNLFFNICFSAYVVFMCVLITRIGLSRKETQNSSAKRHLIWIHINLAWNISIKCSGVCGGRERQLWTGECYYYHYFFCFVLFCFLVDDVKHRHVRTDNPWAKVPWTTFQSPLFVVLYINGNSVADISASPWNGGRPYDRCDDPYDPGLADIKHDVVATVDFWRITALVESWKLLHLLCFWVLESALVGFFF